MKVKFVLLTVALTSLFSYTTHAQTMLSDDQIKEVMEEASDAEIDAAKLAKKETKNKEVRDFANRMIAEHEKNLKEAKKIAKKHDIDGKDSDMSDALEANAKNKRKMLKELKGPAFDKMYLDQEVSMHTQLINDLDQKFIPSATNPEFKTYLQTTREHVSKHLDMAKTLQTKL